MAEINVSRRKFLKVLAGGVVVLSVVTQVKGVLTENKTGKRYAMYIDVEKCFGCYACVVACAAENNVPLGYYRTWVERHVSDGGIVSFVPKQCNHCDNPPCIPPCPVKGATFKTGDGLVLVDDKLCIGCGACVAACPYGARFLNPIKGVADKCTFCNHRLATGRLPACVEACPTGARIFGSLTVEGELKQLIETKPTSRLKEWTGANPMIFYKSLPSSANR